MQAGLDSLTHKFLSSLPSSVSGQAQTLLTFGDDTLAAELTAERTDAREITASFDVVPRQASNGLAKISDSEQFRSLVCGVILGNSFFIALEAWYITHRELAIWFSIIDFLFTAAYCGEVWIRWKDHGVWTYFFGLDRNRSFWNWFDFFVTASGVLSLFLDAFGGSGVIRLFRILRLARTFRIAKFMGDIEYVLQVACQAVSQLAGMIGLILFLFAILFTELLYNSEHEDVVARFGDLSKSLWTLFQLMTLNDWAAHCMPVMTFHPFTAPLFMVFIYVSAIALLTLVPAMFVDQNMNERERAADALDKSTKHQQTEHDHLLLTECFHLADANDSGEASLHEMKGLLRDEAIIQKLFERGLAKNRDMKDITLGLFDLVRRHEKELSQHEVQLTKEEFVHYIFKERNDKGSTASWRSATSIRLLMTKFKAGLNEDIDKTDAKLDSLRTLLEGVNSHRNPGQQSRLAHGLRHPISTQTQPDSAEAGDTMRPAPKALTSRPQQLSREVPATSPQQSPRQQLQQGIPATTPQQVPTSTPRKSPRPGSVGSLFSPRNLLAQLQHGRASQEPPQTPQVIEPKPAPFNPKNPSNRTQANTTANTEASQGMDLPPGAHKPPKKNSLVV